MKDLYYILGIYVNSSTEEIREAFSKLSNKFHPYRNKGDDNFETQFSRINEAYETLSDPDKRKKYDASVNQVQLNPIDEEFERRKRWKEQASVKQKYTSRLAANGYKKGPGIGLSIVLVIIGLIFIVYIVQSFSGSKPKIVKPLLAVRAAPPIIRKHRKKKHASHVGHLKEVVAIKPDSIPFTLMKEIAKKGAPVKPGEPVPAAAVRIAPANGSFLYSTYVRPNITGIVNMRESDQYSSAVTNVIPADSKVDVIEKGNIYYKVSFNNHIGYVPKWSLEQK